MNFNKFKEILTKIESLPLPGQASQFKMSPPFREKLISLQKDNIKRARKAAVMALFYPNKNKEACIVLILRETYKGVHSAQIGFPGGKIEEEDDTLKHTALRETEEEIGVAIHAIEVVKQLTSIYIPPSNFYVYPFMGVSISTPKFVKQDSEVKAVIEVAVSDFFDEKNTTTKLVSTKYKKEVAVPAYNLNGHLVWGATAMILSEVKDLLKELL